MRKHPAFLFSESTALDFLAVVLFLASNNSIVENKTHRALHSNLTTLLGVVICASSAALMSILFHERSARTIVPLVLLIVVVLVSVRFGVLAGVLGSAVAALVLAVLLYAPLGSPAVDNRTARSNLGWFVLGGITISYLLGSSVGGHRRHG